MDSTSGVDGKAATGNIFYRKGKSKDSKISFLFLKISIYIVNDNINIIVWLQLVSTVIVF